jgi:GDP-mannose 6-dehydrogenase
MKISIFGLGYVGIVSGACLSSLGHKIIGVDINDTKIQLMNDGKSPIIEKGVSNLLLKAKKKKMISATKDSKSAVFNSKVSLISVGTPSKENGSLSTKYLEMVSKEIGLALKEKKGKHYLIFRSTMLPGTLKSLLIPILEKKSGKKEGKDFFVTFNPEFLRESTAVYDFFHPPKTVIGANSKKVSKEMMKVYESIPGIKIQTSIEVAEMVKYVDNVFHALKITFGNEIGHICKSLEIDSHEVMDIFVKDRKLNISPYYLKPGFAYGGSCLPKDLRALTYLSKKMDLQSPLLNSISISNDDQILKTIKKIISYNKRKIGIAGFAFKAGTDDLRESPIVQIIEALIGKGFDLKLYDKNVSLAKLIGANKEYINKKIPHISNLIVNSLDELNDREIIIIGNKDKSFKKFLKNDKQIIFDLVRIGEISEVKKNYNGICW